MEKYLMQIFSEKYTYKAPFRRLFRSFRVGDGKFKRGALALLFAALLFVSLSVPAMAANAKSLTEQNRAMTESSKGIALQFAKEGWGTQSSWEETWDTLVSPNLVYHFNSAAEPIVGLTENKAFNKSLFQGFPDIRQTIEDLLAEGDKVVYRSTLQGTNTGEFLGAPPTNKPVKVNDFTMLKISDGQIVEMWYECNLLEVMQQMGLIPRVG
jgi:predicted ester cyclase